MYLFWVLVALKNIPLYNNYFSLLNITFKGFASRNLNKEELRN